MLRALENMKPTDRKKFFKKYVKQVTLPISIDLLTTDGISPWLFLNEAPQNFTAIHYFNDTDIDRKFEIVTNTSDNETPDFSITSELLAGEETVFDDLLIPAGEKLALRLWNQGGHVEVSANELTLEIHIS